MKNSLKRIKFNSLVNYKVLPKIRSSINEVIKSEWFILGKNVEKFEKNFVNFLGVKYCIGVGNGLEALQISLMSLGIGEGDQVITTPISAVATTLAILAVGAKPVFVDTDENGLININLIQKAITKKTKAVLPVHLYGHPINTKKLQQICKRNKLNLLEDACQAHGSTFNGKKLGSFGDINSFSFYPTKNLGALGDGGAIVTNNSKLAKICFEIRDYGQKEKYIHSRFGLNSRLDEVQAAILNIKLSKLLEENRKRQKLAARYIKNLQDIKGIYIIKPENLEDSCFHIFAIRVKSRKKLINYLKSKNIPTLIHYPLAIPDQPFLKKEYGSINIPNARRFVKETLSLPLHPRMSFADIDFICQNIKNFSLQIPL